MSDVDKWGLADSANVDAPPDGAPELHARTSVNNITREMMAAVRRQFEDPSWFDKSKGPLTNGFTLTRLGDFQVNLAHESTPTDASAKYPTGARVRIGDGATLVYGFITTAVYGAPNTVITLDLDGASVVQATPTTLESHITDESLGDTAFSPRGTTTGQDPPEVPAIDDLGDGATVDQGAGNGFDADTLDGLHAADLITAAGAARGVGLINGDFAIGQRGHTINDTTAFLNDNAAYVVDGWQLLMGKLTGHPAGGSGVVDIDLIESNASQGSSANRAVRITGNGNLGGAPTEKVGLIQWLPEDVTQKLRDSTVSLSVWARIAAGPVIQSLRLALVEWRGTADALTNGGDPIADWGAVGVTPTTVGSYVLQVGSTETLTTQWVEYKLENQPVNISAKNLAVLIYFDDTTLASGDLVEVTGVSLVAGAEAAAYSQEDYASNLLRCQRFFNSTFEEGATPRDLGSDETTALRTLCVGGSRGLLSWEFSTSMFKTPGITRYNPGPSGATGVAWNATRGLVTGVLATYPSKRRAQWFVGQGGDNPEDEYVMHATADATL